MASTNETAQPDDRGAKLPRQKIKYPSAVFYIVAYEACERFCHYGLRAVLPLYFRNILHYNEDVSTVLYHSFAVLCHFTSVLGACLADSWLGKFRTIAYMAVINVIGNIVLSTASVPGVLPQLEFSLLGLFVVAMSAGGVPCVSAFGGDQFVRPEQESQLNKFFSWFYVAINAATLLSVVVTPMLREDVHCFGDASCFPLAFGAPAVAIVVAFFSIYMGHWLKTYRHLPIEKETNVLIDVCKCAWYALKKRLRTVKQDKVNEVREHWLDYATDQFDRQLIEDTKQIIRLFVLYLPIPAFWALFDQQGSRWTFQATRMDGALFDGWLTIKPDQLIILNPILVLILIPVFDSWIYPILSKCGANLSPLQKMTVGGIFTALAFAVSGVVELKLEETYPQIPADGLTQLHFVNTLPCPATIQYLGALNTTAVNVEATGTRVLRDLKDEEIHFDVTVDSERCKHVNLSSFEWSGNIRGSSSKGFSVLITRGDDGKLEVARMLEEESLDKSKTGDPRLRFIWKSNIGEGNVTIHSPSSTVDFTSSSQLSGWIQTDVRAVESGTYDVSFGAPSGKNSSEGHSAKAITVSQGGCYTMVIIPTYSQDVDDDDNFVLAIEVTPRNSIHMLWLSPQYFLMAVAEIMLCVTGMHFSFTQAPSRMRSIVQAAWILGVAFGNLIVIAVAEARPIPRQAMEFFLFAALMAVDVVVFIFLALNYTYYHGSQDVSSAVESDHPQPGELIPADEEEKVPLNSTSALQSTSAAD